MSCGHLGNIFTGWSIYSESKLLRHSRLALKLYDIYSKDIFTVVLIPRLRKTKVRCYQRNGSIFLRGRENLLRKLLQQQTSLLTYFVPTHRSSTVLVSTEETLSLLWGVLRKHIVSVWTSGVSEEQVWTTTYTYGKFTPGSGEEFLPFRSESFWIRL